MGVRAFAAIFLAVSLLLTGYSGSKPQTYAKKQASSYKEELIELTGVPELHIEIDSGHLEAYSWEKKAVKLEITRRLTCDEGDTANGDAFKNFYSQVECDGNNIFFKSSCGRRGRGTDDAEISLRAFIPRKVSKISCKIQRGSIKFFDDLKCDFTAELGGVSTEIKYFEGNMNLEADSGSLRIENGRIRGDLSVSVDTGNIYIKARIDEGGSSTLSTKAGNIDVRLPSDSKVSFENVGTVEVNEFTVSSYDTKVKLDSGIGRIFATKY
ncbi:hypothetical protein DFR58_11329 [Anaerobacterium chartisolvens]|uniref:Adhesin n=1 Tax=Anaerobacterium chartisolvens TaxID=1297424 RepID=A0A369B1M0_9FIRM|nr:hypothetical protein [Anaerobacterium chartisolvens]RCX15449.1 hypothetical protein DFR58_11329 [Anaerobacterium chartisolvens]